VPRRRRVIPTLAQRLAVPVTEAAVLPAGRGPNAAPLAAERATTELAGGKTDELFEELRTGQTSERPAGMRVKAVPDGIEKRLPPIGRKRRPARRAACTHWGIVLYVRDTETLLRA